MADIDLGEALKKSILGAKEDEVIKSGTTAVTRGIGVVALGFVGTFYLLEQFADVGPWTGLDTGQRLTFVIAAAAVWAIVAAADVIGRGLAHENDVVTALPRGLTATKTKRTDDPGWSVVAIRFPSGGTGDPRYLVVKAGQPVEWLSAEDLRFG